jgi:hypothetical protein
VIVVAAAVVSLVSVCVRTSMVFSSVCLVVVSRTEQSGFVDGGVGLFPFRLIHIIDNGHRNHHDVNPPTKSAVFWLGV